VSGVSGSKTCIPSWVLVFHNIILFFFIVMMFHFVLVEDHVM